MKKLAKQRAAQCLFLFRPLCPLARQPLPVVCHITKWHCIDAQSGRTVTPFGCSTGHCRSNAPLSGRTRSLVGQLWYCTLRLQLYRKRRQFTTPCFAFSHSCEKGSATDHLEILKKQANAAQIWELTNFSRTIDSQSWYHYSCLLDDDRITISIDLSTKFALNQAFLLAPNLCQFNCRQIEILHS